MQTNWTRNALCGLATVAALAPAASAQNYFTDFSQGDAGWTHYEPLEPFGAGGTFTFPATGGYRMQAPPSPDPANLSGSRVGSIAPPAANTSSDFYISADLIDFNIVGGTTVAGIGFHGSNPGLGTTNGYALWAFLNPATNETTLRFNVITNEVSTAIGTSSTIPGLNPVRLTVRGIGDTYTGQLRDLTTNALLAEVSATDSIHGPGGFSGLLVAGGSGANPTLDATWGTFTAVPAPGTFALLAFGGIAAARRRR